MGRLTEGRGRFGDKRILSCFEGTLAEEGLVLVSFGLFSLGESLLEDAPAVELGPDEVGNGWDLNYPPASPFPDQHFEQFRVIPFLNVDVEVADIGRNPYFNPVQPSDRFVQVCSGEGVFVVGVQVGQQAFPFKGVAQQEGTPSSHGGGSAGSPALVDGFFQLLHDGGALPENLSDF